MDANNNVIEQILDKHTPAIQQIVGDLRRIVKEAAPELAEEGKAGWQNITYSHKGVVCAISPYKKWVNLHFYQGVDLSDPENVLEGGGKKLRHVKIHSPADIRRDVLSALVREAAALES